MKNCLNCGAQIADDDKFCPYCGMEVFDNEEKKNSSSSCPNCNKELKPYEKYCPICGTLNPGFDENAKETEYRSEEENRQRTKNSYEPVGAFAAYKLYFKNYFNFTGRSSRAEYWYPVLFNFIISIILSTVDRITNIQLEILKMYEFELNGELYVYYAGLFSTIFELIVFIPALACLIRRLRDTGKSPIYILFILIPIVGPFILIYWLAQETDRYL